MLREVRNDGRFVDGTEDALQARERPPTVRAVTEMFGHANSVRT
jgi:hypothetical protein